MVECQSCHGQYEPIGADGVRYFHVCPPLSAAELRAALGAGRLQLTDANAARLAAAQKADAAKGADPGAPAAVEAFLASLVIERVNKRDENIDKPATAKAPAVIKAEGDGVLEVLLIDAPGNFVVQDV